MDINRFELWKAIFKKIIQKFDFSLCETIINTLFLSTHLINDKVVDKSNFLWTTKEKRKFEIHFKTKNLLTMSLDEIELFYVHNCNSTKEMWNTFEMISEVSPSIKQDIMNTRDEEDECLPLEVLKLMLEPSSLKKSRN